MKGQNVLFSSNSDHWSTPSDIYNHYIDLGYFDPCPLFSDFDGLSLSWRDKNFVNPPYSDIRSWVEKSLFEVSQGKEVVLLVPSRTDVRWFHSIMNCGYNVVFDFIKGRLRFGGSKNCAPFPSVLITIKKY